MKRFFLLSIVASLSLPAFSSDKIIPPGPFEETKVVLIDEFKNLVVLMNMDCAQNHGLQKLNQFPELELMDHTPNIKMKRKVLKLLSKRKFNEDRLEEYANASDCIIGVTNDVEYKINNTFNDPRFSEQTHHPNLKTEEFYRKTSWSSVDPQDKAVIAVVDTGVDYTHSDLTDVMFRRNNQVVGANFVAGATGFYDDHGHGTHVAGLASAEGNNFLGGTGVCAFNCFVMPVKVLSKEGSGLLSDITNGVFWSVENGADIINMSLGRTINFAGMAPLELEAFRYAMMKNVIVAVAAGNDGATLSMTGPQSWPAMFAELPGVVTVGSLDALSGNLSTFSNRSPRYVEIGAPGSSSSTNGTYVGLLSTAAGGGYVKMSGTSMATPVVAGALGLIISHFKKNNITYSIWDAEKYLKSSTRVNPSLTTVIEAGRVLDLSVLADELQRNQQSEFRLNINEPYERFVNDLYYILMRRNYDPGGAEFNLDIMKRHKISFEDMILNFMKSAEYKTRIADISNYERIDFSYLVDHFLPDTYLVILGRLPTKAEHDFWLDYLSLYRNKLRFMIRTLLKSQEFTNRIHGTSLQDHPRMEKLPEDEHAFCDARKFVGNFTVPAQVDYAYCAVLERTPDAGGREWYSGLIQNGQRLEDIMFYMYKSQEYSTRNEITRTTDRTYVNILYYTLLHRFPASHEAFYWMEALKRISRDDLLKVFLESEEFRDVLKRRSVR